MIGRGVPTFSYTCCRTTKRVLQTYSSRRRILPLASMSLLTSSYLPIRAGRRAIAQTASERPISIYHTKRQLAYAFILNLKHILCNNSVTFWMTPLLSTFLPTAPFTVQLMPTYFLYSSPRWYCCNEDGQHREACPTSFGVHQYLRRGVILR